ncbi:tyrosine-protein phosphatase [Companilactobacillus sp. HBUAS59544]|uniref:tyrosine-protein phosphatase n=1 Tax=Companilactobacillus sp. HBUAS59544 TaxID=3109363 RepID=UPI002FF00FAA
MDKKDFLIPLKGTFNTRDLGGYKASDGRKIKYSRIYRSDDLFKLTGEDIDWFVNHKLTTVIDFRNKNERVIRPDKNIPNVRYYILSPDDDTAALASADLRSDKKKIDKLILEKNNGTLDLNVDGLKNSMVNFVKSPNVQRLYKSLLELHIQRSDAVVLQHCRGGKDRTGYGSALILFALGVSEEDVINDYMLTGKYNVERNKRRMSEYRRYTDDDVILRYLSNAMSTRREVIESGIYAMKEISGTPINYIEDVLGFDKIKIRKMRSIYLE